MKHLPKILIALALVAAAWLGLNWWKKSRALKTPSARDKEDVAADVFAANADRLTAQTVTSGILTPKASWVRPNGAIIDLNRLGGGIPALVTLPTLDAWN